MAKGIKLSPTTNICFYSDISNTNPHLFYHNCTFLLNMVGYLHHKITCLIVFRILKEFPPVRAAISQNRNYEYLFTDSEKSLLPPCASKCRAGRRPDFVRKTMQVHRRCTQLGPETRPAKCLAEEL